jgi:hypothetical protein
VTPMTQEALPLIDALSSCRTSLLYCSRYGDSLGLSSEDILELYGNWLKGSVLRMAERFDKDVVVLRGPLLGKHLINFLSVARQVSLEFKIVFMVRWPLDAIASMYTWDERSLAKGGGSIVPASDDNQLKSQRFAENHISYYTDLAKITDYDASGIKVLRYEDLVTAPREVASKLGSFLDLDLSGGDAAWNNSLLSYTPRLGEFVTPLYGQEVSDGSIGRGDSLFDEQDTQIILSTSRFVVRAFYYEKDPLKTNSVRHPSLI